MHSYKEMILQSRKALVYELVLNQITYHSIACLLLLTYSYGCRTLWEKETKGKNLFEVLKESGVGLIKLRGFFCCLSLGSEFWVLKLNMKKMEGGYGVSVGVKRFLLLKEMMVQLLWFTGILKIFHEKYPSCTHH